MVSHVCWFCTVFFFISLFFSLKAILFLLFCPNFNEAVPCLFFSMFPSTKSLTSKRWFHSVHGHPTMKKHARMVMLTSEIHEKMGRIHPISWVHHEIHEQKSSSPKCSAFFSTCSQVFPTFFPRRFPTFFPTFSQAFAVEMGKDLDLCGSTATVALIPKSRGDPERNVWY